MASTAKLRTGDEVWVQIGGLWRGGVVTAPQWGSPFTHLVRYRRNANGDLGAKAFGLSRIRMQPAPSCHTTPDEES